MSLGKPGFGGSGLGQPGVSAPSHSPDAPAGPLNLTNAEKLALPANTPPGTVVQVTDGFVVSGAGDTLVNGFWFESDTANGKPLYTSTIPGATPGNTNTLWDGTEWHISDESGNLAYLSSEDVDYPWQVVAWTSGDPSLDPAPTLTHPAVQTLAAPSTAQGGVFVSGGTQEGVYTARGISDGKNFFTLIGHDDSALFFSISWDPNAGGRWIVYDFDDIAIYYSLSDVATPDLATDWLNAIDDTPAGITVTSVSQGEIDAGLAVTNDGVTNGSSYVSQPFHGRHYYTGLLGGGSNNMHWDTDFNVWTDDVGTWTTDNVAFPWQGADNGAGGHTGATFARNDVATEANWEVVPRQ